MKTIIISPVVCNPNTQSKVLKSFFGTFDKNDLYHFFTDSNLPCKNGLCCSYYQISDRDMFNLWIKKRKRAGLMILDSELNANVFTTNYSTNTQIKLKKRSIKIKKNYITSFIRNLIWKTKRVCNNTSLFEWAEKIKPDYIFYDLHSEPCFSKICLDLVKKTNARLILYLGDDYLFSSQGFTLNPFKILYYRSFKKTFKHLVSFNPYCFFVSDKMKDFYKSKFKLDGETFTLINENDFNFKITKNNEKDVRLIFYGSTSYGRLESLLKFSKMMHKNNFNGKIDVYPNTLSKSQKKRFAGLDFVYFHERVPYEELVKNINQSTAIIVTEGFRRAHVKRTMFSLSTKAFDCISSKKPIIAYGAKQSGFIDYLLTNKIGFVATSKKELNYLAKNISYIISTCRFENYDIALDRDFNKEKNERKFLKLYE